MIIEIVLFCLLIFIVYQIDKKPRYSPPGLWGLPLIGDLSTGGLVSVEKQKEFAAKYGNIFSVRFGQTLSVFLADFDTIKYALNHPNFQSRPPLYPLKFFSYFKNLGFGEADGETWSQNRRHALFHLKDLGVGKSRIQYSIQKEVEHLISHFEKQGGKPVNLGTEINVAVLNVIWQLVANERYEIEDERMKDFLHLPEQVFTLLQGPSGVLTAFPFLKTILPEKILGRFFGIDDLHECREKIYKFLNEKIDEHADKFNPNNVVDYIDHCLLRVENGKNEPVPENSRLNVPVSLFDLFVAGSETTSSTLRWFILFMATHPEEQKKVQDLIDEVVPQSELPSLEDKPKLAYLEAVLMETLRFSSFVPQGVPHAATEDTRIGEFVIPKGAAIFPCLKLCHTNPEYFEKPTEFFPSHFIGENGELLTKKRGYAPFSVGKRQCLGESLAKAELFLLTSSILQKFKINPHPDHPLDLKHDTSQLLFNFPKNFRVCFINRI